MSGPAKKPRFPVYGYLAEFGDEHALLDAVRSARRAGYSVMEAYTPLPVEEISHELGYKNRLPWIVLGGGVFGALLGYGMQVYAAVHSYPINVGGRPLHSWPSFIVITFETTILCAALAAVLGMFALNGLPQPYHPVFNVPGFELASRNRFFLMILSRDPRFDLRATETFLAQLAPLSLSGVEH